VCLEDQKGQVVSAGGLIGADEKDQVVGGSCLAEVEFALWKFRRLEEAVLDDHLGGGEEMVRIDFAQVLCAQFLPQVIDSQYGHGSHARPNGGAGALAWRII